MSIATGEVVSLGQLVKQTIRCVEITDHFASPVTGLGRGSIRYSLQEWWIVPENELGWSVSSLRRVTANRMEEILGFFDGSEQPFRYLHQKVVQGIYWKLPEPRVALEDLEWNFSIRYMRHSEPVVSVVFGHKAALCNAYERNFLKRPLTCR